MTDTIIHVSHSKFTPQEHAADCSRPEEEVGFGLAGGGYGAYGYCPECYATLWKSEEHDDDGQPDEAQEWADFDREC
jgi:hypothetical protein